MHQFLPYAWFGGQCVPFAEATLSVATHALHYGTGAFGGMRALPNPADNNEILLFRADRHARRLSQSARLLLTELPEETIHSAIQAFLQANRPTCPVYLRPFVYTSDLGIAPRLHNIQTDFLIYGIEMGDYLSPEGVSCRISSWCRQEDRSLPLRGKISGAYITSSLAKTEAVKSGFDEALLLNSRGKVSEASGMNLFIVRDGVLGQVTRVQTLSAEVTLLTDREAAIAVLNARTGSVVFNEAVAIGPCAVAHGSLSVTISTTPAVSQPAPFGQGETTVVERSDITIAQQGGAIVQLPEGAKLADVVRALNALGATPQDLLAILQAMRTAGALKAEIEVI